VRFAKWDKKILKYWADLTFSFQLEKKAEDAESSIADLNQQLIDLTTADCMSRVRDRQDTLLHSIQQKHNREMFTLKEKMDETTKVLEEKVKTGNIWIF
jgi:hypothetical protein